MSHQAVLSPETHALLRRIVEEVPDPVAVLLAPDWRVVYANRRYRALPPGDGRRVIGERLADLFPGAIAAGAVSMLEEARRTGETVTRRAMPISLVPGAQPSWWDVGQHPLPDSHGDLGAVLVILRDVTAEVVARQQADAAAAALERRAEQMRLAIGAGRMYFWDWNIETGAVEWSDGLEAACGMAPGSFGGTLDAFRALLHPGDLPRVEAALAAALAGETPYDIEFRMMRADGGERWVLSRATVQRDASGRPLRMVGIDLDLTERKRAEAAQAESAAMMRLVQEAADLGVWEWDTRQERQRWSARQFALHGIDPAAGAPSLDAWMAMVRAEDRPGLYQAARDGVSDEDGRYRALFRIARADDRTERWLAALGRVVESGPEGEPLRLQGVNFDVTRLFAPPVGEGDDTAFLRSVLDASTDCTKVVEPDGTLSFMNANGLCLMEIEDFAPMRGCEWASLWPADGQARVRQAVATALAGQSDRFEAFCPTARGAPRRWDVMVAPVRDAAGRVVRVVATSRDISALKRTEERLQQEIAARETLVREADHRIKNSLQMAAGLLRMQQSRTEDQATAEALGKATARVLSVAEAHRSLYQSSDLRSIDLCRLLQDMAAHLGSLSSAVSVRCTCQEVLPLDAERGIPLGLLTNELITNAIRHAYPDGAAGIVEAAAMVRGEEIVLTVADAGRGMPAAPSKEAPGLGSLLIRSLARQCGATVAVETGPGQGTRVTVRLPLHPAPGPGTH